MSFSTKIQVAQGDAPRVTVLMSVYNGEKNLGEAVESILAQTFTDFEFLIINDGSTDGTRDILESYNDERLRIFGKEDKDLIRSLNAGLHLARGEYIARMDADDVSHPKRLELQIEALDSSPNVDLVASFSRLIDENGRFLGQVEMETDGIYRLWILQFRNVYVHGSVTYRRRQVVDLDGYREKYLYSEDYDLWLRMTTPHSAVIIPKHLYDLRISPDSISRQFQETQQRLALEISSDGLRLCDPSLTHGDLAGMRPLYCGTDSGNLTIAGLRALKGTLEGFCVRHGIEGGDKRTLFSRVTRDMIRGVMASNVMSAEEKARIPEIMWALASDAVPPEEVLGTLWDETISVGNERDRLGKERENTVFRLAGVVQRFWTRLLVKYPAIEVLRQVSSALLQSVANVVQRIESSAARSRKHWDA